MIARLMYMLLVVLVFGVVLSTLCYVVSKNNVSTDEMSLNEGVNGHFYMNYVQLSG